MENTKGLYIVLISPVTPDPEEFMRLKAVYRDAMGKEMKRIVDNSTATIFVIRGEYQTLAKELNEAINGGTSMFIARLSMPCATIGLAPLRAILQDSGLMNRQK